MSVLKIYHVLADTDNEVFKAIVVCAASEEKALSMHKKYSKKLMHRGYVSLEGVEEQILEYRS